MSQSHRAIAVTLLAATLTACAAPSSDEGPSDSSGTAAATVDPAVDRAALTALLDDFLARADQASAHERFWADDLIYTSSNGTRRGKAEIMAGYETEEDDAPDAAEEPGPTYSAEDVDIRFYGETAVVAFRLVIEPPARSGEASSYNWNTGTFVKRDGEWRVVAWQSTRGAE